MGNKNASFVSVNLNDVGENEFYAAQWQEAAAVIEATMESLEEAGFSMSLLNIVYEKINSSKVGELAQPLL